MKTNELNRLPEGTRIGNRYEIIEVIGQGGFGITYRGYDVTLDVPVAIKEYYPSGIASRYSTQSLDVQVGGSENMEQFEKGKEKFLEEARVLARISRDPNIVSVRDYFEDNETAYIVMEFLEGESLKAYIDRTGKMTFDEAFGLLRPVMHSLDNIHKNGLIHRDISPSNLIRLEDGRIKLIDFGTTREINMDGEKSLSILLKPGYAPPEQYKSRGSQGAWTDVYAMSASIYKLITGMTPENSLARVLADELPSPSGCGAEISPAQEKALMKGLAIDYKERFQDMKELEEALDAASAGQETEDQPDTDEEVTMEGPFEAEGASDSGSKEDREVPVKAKKAGKPLGGAGAKKKKETRPGKKKKRIIIAAIAGLAVIAAAVVAVVLSVNDPTIAGGRVSSYVDGSQHVHFGNYGEETVITADILDKLDASPNVNELAFIDCEISDDVISRMGSMKRIEKIEFDSCSGFTSLDPLAGIDTLKELCITYRTYSSETAYLNGNEVFRTGLPQISKFGVDHITLKGGLDFLGRFTGLESLQIYDAELDEAADTMPEMPSLKSVYIHNTDLSQTDISALGKAEDLTIVEMVNDDLGSLSFLKDADSLQYVHAGDNRLTSLDGLQEKPLIQTIHVANNQISDISSLAGDTGLILLDANDNQISDISSLNECTALQELYLGNNLISDTEVLSGCINLNKLDLAGNQIKDLAAISSCEKLNVLTISRNEISDLSFCERMIKLKRLMASDNEISDLSGLKNITQLDTVYLDNNQISDIQILAKNGEHLKLVVLDNNKISDLSPLKACTNLYGLSVNNNLLTSLSGLEECVTLYSLSASGNEISDISALAACTSLYAADLGENEITDISALGESKAGKMVILLQNNHVKDISVLYGEKDYAYLVLYNNEITDISPLSVMTRISSASTVYLDWTESLDVTALAQSRYSNPKLIGVPLDKQVNMQNEYKELKKDDNMFDAIQYMTVEEAESEITDIRAKVRNAAGIAQ